MASLADHVQLLDHARRTQAHLQLLWLRDGDSTQQAALAAALERLFSAEGEDRLESALRDGRYAAAELRCLPVALAELARDRVLGESLALWARFTQGHGLDQARIPIGSEQRTLSEVAAWVWKTSAFGHAPSTALRSLDAVFAPHAHACVELRQRADEAYREQLADVEKRVAARARDARTAEVQAQLDVLRAPPGASSMLGGLGSAAGAASFTAQSARAVSGVEAPLPQAARMSTVQRAREWLDRTQDAAHELRRFVVKRALGTYEPGLAPLLTALRAPQFDGLARSEGRTLRLAQGARRAGFERDMSARMRADVANNLLWPAARCVALEVPWDVRVLSPGVEFGVLSDLATAQGIGEGLALACASPALGALLKQPLGPLSVSSAFGGLWAQLRAEPAYLKRVDGLDKQVALALGRHAALWILLRARLAAALVCAWQQPSRSNEERLVQLMAAGERALGVELPRGCLGLLALGDPAAEFEASAWGCELHAALRERYDEDFYLNPRTSEVLRGAAARGNALDAVEFGAELASSSAAGLSRMLEILG